MSRTVLIVDDSAMTRSMIKRVIKLTGLPVDTIHEAVNGHEALKFLAKNPVGLVLADLNMPVMDGFAMIRWIRACEKTRQTPVVVISAAPGAEEFAQQNKVAGFLPKPCTPESIQDVLNKVFEVTHAH